MPLFICSLSWLCPYYTSSGHGCARLRLRLWKNAVLSGLCKWNYPLLTQGAPLQTWVVVLSIMGDMEVWPRLNIKPGPGIPNLKMRRSRDRLIFNMGISILIRRHLYVETAPQVWINFAVGLLWNFWVKNIQSNERTHFCHNGNVEHLKPNSTKMSLPVDHVIIIYLDINLTTPLTSWHRWGHWTAWLRVFLKWAKILHGEIAGIVRGTTGHRWIPFTKASDAELWCFLWSAP